MIARGLALAGAVGAALALSASPAMALSASRNVLLIPGPDPVPASGYQGQDGIMPHTNTTVAGRPDESFGKFTFTSLLPPNTPVTPTTSITAGTLSKYDTVALIQVHVSSLSASAKSALAQFVANGGKLLIHDADQTLTNDYSWVLGQAPGTTAVGAGCNHCGSTSGSSSISENTGLISANPSDPTYVNIADMQKYTDTVGDANLLTSLGQGWFAAASGTNGNGNKGAQIAYSTPGKGLVVYNGFDTDMIMSTASSPWRCVMDAPTFDCPAGAPHEQEDWVAQMWYNELNQSWGTSGAGLPQTNPVSSIGTQLPTSQAGLPSTRACVARRRIFLRLRNLTRSHRNLMRIDVYVNGHRRLTEHGHWHNVTLRKLPKKGNFTVKVVATTRGHYRLISTQRYHVC